VLRAGHYFDISVNGSRFKDTASPLDASTYSAYPIIRVVLKMLSPVEGDDLMSTRIANRAIVTIQVISQVAIIIATGMILTVIGASIYESVRTLH
jgi:hypothetical protein